MDPMIQKFLNCKPVNMMQSALSEIVEESANKITYDSIYEDLKSFMEYKFVSKKDFRSEFLENINKRNIEIKSSYFNLFKDIFS